MTQRVTDTLFIKNRLRDIKILGNGIAGHLAQACLEASLSSSTDQVTEMSFRFEDDDDFGFWSRGTFAFGTAVSYGPWRLTIEQVTVEQGRGRPNIVVKAPSRFVTRLRSQTGERNWGKVDISTWVRQRANDVDMKHLVQPGLGSQEIVREKPKGDKQENDWDLLTQVAKKRGAWCFEHADTLVFARPSWLFNRPGLRQLSFTWNSQKRMSDALTEMPKFKDAPHRRDQELTLKIVSDDMDAARPGDSVNLGGGVHRMGGGWIVTKAEYPLTRTAPVVLTCKRPVDPEPEKDTDPEKDDD